MTRLVLIASLLAFLFPTIVTTDPASARQKGPGGGLSPQDCYKLDSGCTQFCAGVAGDLRYECFGICDRMLNHCLDTGEWTDSYLIHPGTGKPPEKRDLLAGSLLRMMMILADTNGDGVLSPEEIAAFKKQLNDEPPK